jgi:hypothetical protein
MANPYVFISYSRKDRQFVEKLVERLRRSGVNTWTDLENILPGQDFASAIDNSVINATALIFVASRSAGDSAWITREVELAVRRNAPVIPALLDDEGERHMPFALRGLQWVDFRENFEPAFEKLLAGVRNLQKPEPVEPAQAKSKGYMFISYAEEDSSFVQDLKIFMETKGYGYWDFRESDRDYQLDYYLELERVIKGASGTLSVISPDWKRSPTAFKEMRFSERVGIPVFLLMAKDPGPTLAIEGLTFIDFTRTPDNGYERLDREMRRKGL